MSKLYHNFSATRRSLMSRLWALSLFGLFALISHDVAAATIRWDNGAGTGFWADAANWAPDGVPTAADDVILDNTQISGGYTVTLSGLNRVARSVQIGYGGNANAIILRITGGGNGDNLRLGGAPGFDLIIADNGTLYNVSTVTGNGNRGVEFIDAANDSWQMTGSGTYLHEQNNGDFINVAPANVSFATTSTFEVRGGLLSTWGGSTGGLSYLKRYGNLRLNPTLAANTTFNFRIATDSVLVTGDLTLFSGFLTVQLTNNNNPVRAHVLGNLTINSSKLYVGAGSAQAIMVVDGNVTTSGTQARIGATASSGDKGLLTVGGNFNAFYTAASNNDMLSFWRPGATSVGTWMSLPGSTYRDVEIRKDVQLISTIGMTSNSGSLRVRNTGTLDFNGYNVTGSGRFDQDAGGTLKITSEGGIAANGASGNVRVTGQRNYSTSGNFWYTGGNIQDTGDGLPATVSSLRIVKNTVFDQVTLTNPVTVSTLMVLTRGQLLIGNNNVVMGTSSVLSGGSPNSYIRTEIDPAATGTLTRRVLNNGTDVLFPVGTSSYTPVTISQAPGSTTDNFSVRVFNGVLTNGTTGTPITNRVVDRTWVITEAVAGGSNATLALQWNIADEGENFTRTSTRIRSLTGGVYDDAMTEIPAQGTDPYRIARSGLGSFSAFIVGSTPVLPVELTRFDARLLTSAVELSWTTASERDCDYFEIQRATTGLSKDFVTIGNLDGNGTTFSRHDYKFIDNQLPTGAMAYYRLRQVDNDGSSHYSNVRAVRLSRGELTELTLFPNPVVDQLSLGVPTTGGVLTVRDAVGRQVLRQAVGVSESAVLLNVASLPFGAYVVDFTGDEGERLTKTFLKQ